MFDRTALDVGLGRRPADAVVRGGRVVNVFTGEVRPADVAIAGDKFALTGDVSEVTGDATQVIDAHGMYVVPGLIDPHVHVEASKMSMTSYAKAVVPHGTTMVFTAFDHIASVLGIRGVRYMLDEAAQLPIRVFNPPPCKVPHTIPPSTLGAAVGLEEQMIAFDWPEASGIAEVAFDYILRDDPGILAAISECERRRLPVHGDGPLVRGRHLGAFLSAGMRDDHESTSKDETIEKLRNGLYVLIRESPAARDLQDCIKAVTEEGLSPRRASLCTDDVDPTTLLDLGHMDHLVRLAIAYGVDPVVAIQMATLNAAEALRLDDRLGGIGPGLYADFLLVPDLVEFRVHETYVGGALVAREGEMVVDVKPPERSEEVLSTFRLTPLEPEDLTFRADLPNGTVRVISMLTPDGLRRVRREVELEVRDGVVLPDPANDVAYVAVIERFNDTGSRSTAFMSGFGLREGALATSNSPDDENVVCLGADAQSMATAINRLIQLGGGQVVARGHEVLAELALPIAGIMSDLEPREVVAAEKRLTEAAHALGATPERPFTWLMFTTITTLPYYALTDRGFVEHSTLSFISPLLGPV